MSVLKNLITVDISSVQNHLKAKATGVSLDKHEMPVQLSEFMAFKGQLEDEDVDRMFLWWEFEKHNESGSCKLTDAVESAASVLKVQSFIEGSSKGKGNVDLRSASGLEIVFVSNDLHNGFLYIIDGSHRTVAQFLMKKSFENVPAYICVHPKVIDWAYVPSLVKALYSAPGGKRGSH